MFGYGQIKTDTTRAVITMGNNVEVKLVYGYVITESHNTLENMREKVSRQDQLLYGHDYTKIVGYILDNYLGKDWGLVSYETVTVKK